MGAAVRAALQAGFCALVVFVVVLWFGSVVLRVWDYQLDHSYVQDVAR